MKLLEQALQTLKAPLPEDARDKLDALIAQAKGQEKALLQRLHSYLIHTGSAEQVSRWYGLNDEE